MSSRIPIPGADLALEAHFVSDLGCVREINQDVAGIFEGHSNERGCLLVVADGMGGAAAGEVASQMALDEVAEAYFDPDEMDQMAPGALRLALERANAVIFRRSTEEIDLSGMGTTCTAVSVLGRNFFVAQIGDSRAYFLRDGEMEQVTVDHSLAEEMRRRSPDGQSARNVPTNVLTRCLGVSPSVEVDLFERMGALRGGDRLLLCSDGLTNMVERARICEVGSGQDPAAACQQLVAEARDGGGLDNITVLIAEVQVR